MVKLSVCMATYNGERFIRRQLETILSQLGPEDEVVVSDDSSTDRTLEVVRSFADPRIRIFAGNTCRSPIFNFENALKQATGDVIALADQDDVWLLNKVEVIREQFNGREREVFLIVMDGRVVDEEERVLEESIFRRINAGPGLLKNIYDNTFLGCSMAFTRPLLEIALPFPRTIPMHDMWLGDLAQIFGSVAFVPEKTVLYRKHGASMTDFKRRFMPVTQIKRRWWLAYHLVKRYLERRES